MIRVGTAGWDYPDWNGVVYPQPRPRGFDALAYLAEFFDAVEVNATFYRIPPPSSAASWVKRTAHRPDFRFTVKLPGTFTHTRIGEQDNDLDEEERRFRSAIAPLQGAGRLGAVLAQFRQSFHARAPEKEALESVLERFTDLPIVVEVRHASWGDGETLDLLRGRGVSFCNIDQPRLPSTLGPTSFVTGAVAYIRLHGRNSADWFREGAGRDRRYDYLYDPSELAPWIEAARRIAEQAPDGYVITNNHFRGKAAVNALQIKAALEGGLVDVPDPLLAGYPELLPIAKPSRGRLPF